MNLLPNVLFPAPKVVRLSGSEIPAYRGPWDEVNIFKFMPISQILTCYDCKQLHEVDFETERGHELLFNPRSTESADTDVLDAVLDAQVQNLSISTRP